MFNYSRNNIINGGTFTVVNNGDKGPLGRLEDATSPAAFHNSGERHDPPKCFPNTRVALLNKIMDWIQGLDPETRDALIVWLHGPAGAGKSAIVQSICDRCFTEELLLASYFFSRLDSTRNHARSLIASIAYQAASYFPNILNLIIDEITADPLVFTRSIDAQILSLLLKPFQHLIEAGYFSGPKSRRLVIIDGLDECTDRKGQIAILHAIANTLRQHHLPLIFLIASRPEHDITHAFGSEYLQSIATRIPMHDDYQASLDIELFLRAEFASIRGQHPFKAEIPHDWPKDSVLHSLVRKSSGQFIYAATAVKFVQSIRHRPQDRLDIVLGIRPPTTHRDMPFGELDALYYLIFSSISAEDIDDVMTILASVILFADAEYGSQLQGDMDYIEQILLIGKSEVQILLCDMQSIASIVRKPLRFGEWQAIKIHHASLVDFLLDERRSGRFYIDAPLRHAEFTHLHLQYFLRVKISSPNTPSWYDILSHHIAQTLRNAKLWEEIVDPDITAILRHDNHSDVVFSLLCTIRKSKFSNRDALYNHVLQVIDRFMMEKLEVYGSDPKLVFLVTIAACHPPYEFEPNTSYTRLFQMNSRLSSVDQQGLRIGCIFSIHSRPSLELFQDFLADPTRSGAYAMDPQKYAEAALYLLRYVCDHFQQIVSCKDLCCKGDLRKNYPWKWRKSTIWKDEVLKRRSRFKIPSQYFNNHWRQLVWQSDEGRTFRLALKLLRRTIRRAGRSEDLIELAKRKAFGPLSMAYPYETEATRSIIQRFLKKMDSEKANRTTSFRPRYGRYNTLPEYGRPDKEKDLLGYIASRARLKAVS